MKTLKTETVARLHIASAMRAAEYRQKEPDFCVIATWTKSRCYVIKNGRGEIMARAGGYGYDKASAALVSFCRNLPDLTDEQRADIDKQIGVGARQVAQAMARAGWLLQEVAYDGASLCYRIRRDPDAQATLAAENFTTCDPRRNKQGA